MTDRSFRRSARRLPFAVVLGFVPVAAFLWVGCGDDDATTGGPLVNVDPGGTWGAEVAVTVVGRGRVITSVRGLDCPSGSCFAKYVFPNNGADGATGGIQLEASPTTGAQFLGWSFEAVNVGARGRGPDSCNPVTRAASVPAVSATEATITLPFGEADGTPPVGQTNCGSFTKVPLAYKITATFDGELPVPDAGFDAGSDETVYDPADTDTQVTTARDVGVTQNGGLYFRYTNNVGESIAYGSNPSSSIPSQTAIKVTTAQTITSFRVHRTGVVYVNGQDVYAIRATNPTNPVLVGNLSGLGTCTGLAIDSSSNVYCRTSASIIRWLAAGSVYGMPAVVYGSGLPAGNDLAVESSIGPIYIDSNTGISSLPLPGPDGGLAAPQPVITGRTQVGNFRADSFGFAWTESGAAIFTTNSKATGSTVTASTANTGIVTSLAPVQGSSGSWIATGPGGIFFAPSFGPSAFRSGPTFTSAAASSQYVFWTSALDARIHRARRF